MAALNFPTSPDAGDTYTANGRTWNFDGASWGSSSVCEAPTFSPTAGSFGEAQDVTISTATSGATIKYTLDDSTPSRTNGTTYSTPVEIATTDTLKAIAYKDSFIDSPVSSGTFTISGSFGLTANTGNGLAANGGTSSSIDTTGANLLVVIASWYPGGGAVAPVVTDSKSNTWTACTERSDAVIAQRVFYCYGGTVGSGHTFTLTGTGSYCTINVAAFIGMASSPLDQQAGGTSSGPSTTFSTGSVTPGQANTILIAGLTYGTNGGTASIDNGFTVINQVALNNGVYVAGAIAYKIMTAATATNPQWTVASAATNAAYTQTSFKY